MQWPMAFNILVETLNIQNHFVVGPLYGGDSVGAPKRISVLGVNNIPVHGFNPQSSSVEIKSESAIEGELIILF